MTVNNHPSFAWQEFVDEVGVSPMQFVTVSELVRRNDGFLARALRILNDRPGAREVVDGSTAYKLRKQYLVERDAARAALADLRDAIEAYTASDGHHGIWDAGSFMDAKAWLVEALKRSECILNEAS